MPNAEKLAKKQVYFDKLIDLCVNTPKALIVRVDHVASKQMQDIRIALRGRAVVLMGKNTMIRKALTIGHESHPEAGLDILRAVMKGNLGFIFATNCELDDIREVLGKFVLESAAKASVFSGPSMLVPKKNRLAVYSYLFKEGVCVAPKKFGEKNPQIEVPNVQVVKLMQSLESRGFVREKFSWLWHYYFLTNEGIEYLREYLHVSPDTVPATLKKSNKPQPPPSFGQQERSGKGKGKGGGGFRGGDRDGYRGDRGGKDGAPGGFNPEFAGGRGKGKGSGLGRGGMRGGRGGGRGGFGGPRE